MIAIARAAACAIVLCARATALFAQTS